MFRITSAVLRNARTVRTIICPIRKYRGSEYTTSISRSFSSIQKVSFFPIGNQIPTSLVNNPSILKIASNIKQQQRTVTKFSIKKGKRKTVKAVIKRFKRLDWGGWIRTHSGRHKKMWKKSGALKRRLRQHLLVNATQSWLLDKMVTKFWRRPKFYVNDPYKPYHTREEYFATRKKPIDY